MVLTGEPGIGKSHIALALQERLQAEPHITLRYFCSAHHTNSALFPFIGQLERAAKFERSDTPAEKLSKLDALVAQSTSDPENVAVLANLFALPADDRYRLQELSPQKRKEKTLAALLALLEGGGASSRFSLLSKMSIGSIRLRWSCWPPWWSICRSFESCCS